MRMIRACHRLEGTDAVPKTINLDGLPKVMKITYQHLGIQHLVLKHDPNYRSYHVQVSTNMTYGPATPVDAVPLWISWRSWWNYMKLIKHCILHPVHAVSISSWTRVTDCRDFRAVVKPWNWGLGEAQLERSCWKRCAICIYLLSADSIIFNGTVRYSHRAAEFTHSTSPGSARPAKMGHAKLKTPKLGTPWYPNFDRQNARGHASHMQSSPAPSISTRSPPSA